MSDYRTKQNELIKQARELHDKAESDGRDLSAEESEHFDNIMADANKYGEQAVKLEKLEAAEKYMKESEGRISQPQQVELPKETKQRYSVMRAIRLLGEGKKLDGLEAEVSQEIARFSGKNPEGFYCPLTLPVETYDLTTTTGAGTIATVVADNDFVKTLRNALVVESMGARLLTGLNGNFAIPVQSAAATATWVGEGVAASQSNIEADASSQVSLSPKTLSANAEYTKKFLKQSSVDAEMFIRQDLQEALALAIDTAALNGDGSGSTPTGILQSSASLVEMDATNGAAPTWAKIVEMESAVANANAATGRLGYITNTKVRGKLKTTEKATGTAQFIYENGNFPINGYACGVSNAMPSDTTKGSSNGILSSMIFGNFNDLLIGLWGGVDLVVDPYTQSKLGVVSVSIFQEADIVLRRVASFSRCTDIITT